MITHLMDIRSFGIYLLAIVCSPLVLAGPLRLLAWDQEVEQRKLALVAGKSIMELEELSSLKRSAPVSVNWSNSLQILALDKPEVDGKPVGLKCSIPEGVKYPLVVLLPNPKHPTGLKAMVLDDDPSQFQWGTFRFLNATEKEFVVRIEDKIMRIPANWKSTDLKLPGSKRGIGVQIAMTDDPSRLLYSSVWEHDDKVRTLCFLVPGTDARRGPLEFKSIPEDKIILELEAKTIQKK